MQNYGIFRICANIFTENFVLFLNVFYFTLIMSDLDVKKIRKNLGLTQRAFAEAIGVDIKTVQNWEAGKTVPATKHGIIRNLTNQQNVNGDNINGNNVTVNKSDTDKLIELLQQKEHSLAKAQEHIDKLLGIISNLTDK